MTDTQQRNLGELMLIVHIIVLVAAIAIAVQVLS